MVAISMAFHPEMNTKLNTASNTTTEVSEYRNQMHRAATLDRNMDNPGI